MQREPTTFQPGRHGSDRLAALASGTSALFATGKWRQPHESWSRCFSHYGLKPEQKAELEAVSEAEYMRRREAMAPLLGVIAPEMNALYAAIKGAGYSLGFVDPDAVTVTYKEPAAASAADDAAKLGAIWTEELRGTNTVGICLLERVPVALLGNDHFNNDIKNFACASTPIFDWNGNIVGVLDASASLADVSEDVHRVIFDVVQAAGIRMEDQLFASHFAGRSLLSIYGENGGCAMLALDDDERIVGLNRFASFVLSEQAIGRKIWDFLDRPVAVTGSATDNRAIVDFRLDRRSITSTVHGSLASAWLDKPKTTRAKPAGADPLDLCGGGDARYGSQLDLIRRVKDTNFPLLLLGETGSGKDMLARAVHAVSNRAGKPFIAFNCAAVPDTLIDSELFGYGAGAFTGAKREGNEGIVAAANGGTLFLDEIGDMPAAQQTRLLRVLESGEITPLGTGKPRKLDIRVIAATNVDLMEQVRRGSFRSDLLYRLAGLVVTIPALRERSDFEGIARAILAENTVRTDLAISPQAMEFLKRHPWPGNIRELRNVLVRAAYLAPGNVIRPEDIYLLPCPSDQPSLPAHSRTVRGAAVEAENSLIGRTLDECAGDVSRAARKLGISRATLYRKIKRYREGGAAE